MHTWSDENLHSIQETHIQRQFTINIRAGNISSLLMGPYMVLLSLPGASYLHFLMKKLLQLLKDVPLAMQQIIQFITDGTPAHFTQDVKQFLYSHYPDLWIEKNGLVLWPLKSPDHVSAGFYLQGHL
jgi:hypothetical protein